MKKMASNLAVQTAGAVYEPLRDRLLIPMGPNQHALVLFDLNRLAAKAPLLISFNAMGRSSPG